MPELPEVETIRRGLARLLPDARIVDVWTSGARLRGPAARLEGMEGRTFRGFRRHGKFLLADLDDGSTWLVHLGMTGKLLIHTKEARPPHTHVELRLSDGRLLRFADPRRFGMMSLRTGTEARHPPELAHYGPDALDPALDAEAFAKRLGASSAPLKAFLLDQTKLAGVGNIYACEALWRARASPRRLARNARDPALLLDSVREVLAESIAQGGTSFNDYVDELGRTGRFLLDVAVFRREGLPCPRCGRAVARIQQGGRSTFYCPRCQR